MSSNMIPQYSTVLFTDIYDNVDDFIADYKNESSDFVNGIPNLIADTSAETLFYLLYGRYGNNPIANRDINQFKYKLFSVIFQYGPTWEKRLEVQAALRQLTLDDIRLGSKAIYNQALNPSTEPSTASLEELTFINQQNTTNYKKSPLEGYAILLDLLNTDVTEEFIKKFNVCFKKFVSAERPLIYVTEEDED